MKIELLLDNEYSLLVQLTTNGLEKLIKSVKEKHLSEPIVASRLLANLYVAKHLLVQQK